MAGTSPDMTMWKRIAIRQPVPAAPINPNSASIHTPFGLDGIFAFH